MKPLITTKEVEKVTRRIVCQTRENVIREDTVTYSDGRKEIHEIVQVPEGVLILPVTQDGRIILTQEYRHNHGWVHGVPMGRLNTSDSSPLDAAKREIKEEVGLSATKWTHISTHHNGVHEESLNHFFIAEGLSNGEHKHDADEDIKKAEITLEEAFRLMDEGKIVDLPTRACIWAGYIHIQNRKFRAPTCQVGTHTKP